MQSDQLRTTFLKFFEERGHTIVSSRSLIPTDPSVLFTSAGMQPFKEYFLGEPSPHGDRVCSAQRCVRTSDIDEVGDESHLTFLEMLGNFSFNGSDQPAGETDGYFKQHAISYALAFLTEQCGLERERLWVTIFEGDEEVPEDTVSRDIWMRNGIPAERIDGFGREENFWGPTGKEGPCGPTTEIHYELHGEPCEQGSACVPNCECDRFLEVWNLVFNEYYQDEDGTLSELDAKGVDTGMGFERLLALLQDADNVFDTDVFRPLMDILVQHAEKTDDVAAFRIIADHMKAAAFIIDEGITPSNVEQGYVLRRLIRRAVRYCRVVDADSSQVLPLLARRVRDVYPRDGENDRWQTSVEYADEVITEEIEAFSKALTRGMREFENIIESGRSVSGKDAFYLYESFGFPLEFTQELAAEHNGEVDTDGFFEAFEKHRERSRQGAEEKFAGGLADTDPETVKLHTAHHLLLAALQQVLGQHVKQRGSNITSERLRIDVSHPEEITEEERSEVERIVNQKIEDDLRVVRREMSLKEAEQIGAEREFGAKYGDTVSVYFIEDKAGNVFSKELCGGPHVSRTGELGEFRITKEKSSGSGIRRIKAVLE